MEQIEGYEGLYELHLNGPNGQPGVWGIKRKHYLKNHINDRGYLQVRLSRSKKDTKLLKLHRLVAIHFINNPDNLKEVDHINRDKSDARVQNLRWVNRSQQIHNQNAKGYTWDKKKNRWLAQIGVGSKNIYLGCYDLENEARDAYIKSSKLYYPGIIT